jgi:hypothetical protein
MIAITWQYAMACKMVKHIYQIRKKYYVCSYLTVWFVQVLAAIRHLTIVASMN